MQGLPASIDETSATARDKVATAATWGLVVIVGVVTYFQLRHQPFFQDADAYARAARSLSHEGVLGNWYRSDLRTYGYPLFLAGAFNLADLLHVGDNTSVFIVQWPVYVGSAWLAATTLAGGRLRLVVFLGLAANPLLIVYTVQAFTESLSLACILFAIGALGRAYRAGHSAGRAAWLLAGALASGYSMAVRPGNLLVPVCYAVAVIFVLVMPGTRGRWASMAITGILVAAALTAPLVPQVLINERHYGKTSPLPAVDLSKIQISYGVQVLRYATNISTTCGTAGLHFLNPDHPIVDMSTAEALRYYSLDWPSGPRTAALHVFSGLDPRPFLIDQHDFGTGYERWLQALTVALLILAGFGVAPAWKALRWKGWRRRPEVWFLGAVAFLATGILATSAAEYRFGAVPLIAISSLAALGLPRVLRPRPALIAVGLGVVLMTGWVAVSDYVLSTSTTWQQCSS